ncbi:unnamed protein product [Brachionus calyciflorus]|uniref:Uncharacterized protein n=1 Tax=Brachionus calyciflorus TaxID=104777 RepID=A0A814BYY8_9BILA|nr:unnamed protein product [Brachionus calyciflorus]
MYAAFVCNTSRCYASVSLRVVNLDIIEPFEITHQNENHKVDCLSKDASYFDIKNFLKIVKTKLVQNLDRSIQQIDEETKAVDRTVSETTLPDNVEVKSDLKKDLFYFFDNYKNTDNLDLHHRLD